MKLPSEPRDGYTVASKIKEIIQYLRGERIVGIIGGRIDQSPNGKTIIIDYPSQHLPKRKRLPFEIYYTKDPTGINDYILSFAPGLIDATAISPIAQAADLMESWYLEAEIQYSDVTGVVYSRSISWVQTEGVNSDTYSYHTLGVVEIGATASENLAENYTYGPMTTISYGDVDDKWRIALI